MIISSCTTLSFFFFFNDTATTEIYTLSLHDALPISPVGDHCEVKAIKSVFREHSVPVNSTKSMTGTECSRKTDLIADRKSTRLNSSHANISYAVFCLKKKQISASVSG